MNDEQPEQPDLLAENAKLKEVVESLSDHGRAAEAMEIIKAQQAEINQLRADASDVAEGTVPLPPELAGTMKEIRAEQRAEQAAVVPAPPKKEKKPKRKSKGELLQEAAQEVIAAVDEAEEALQSLIDEAQGALERIGEAYETLRGVRDDNYSDWNDNLPENLRASALGEKLETLMNIDLDPSVPEIEMPDFDELRSPAQEILDAELPLGFGRD